jgi:GNAT superfamily N-acetyltransferase
MISFRRFRQDDYPYIENFYRSTLDKSEVQRKAAAFRWIQRNPVEDAENGYLLLFVDERLVGYLGIMPARFLERGRAFQVLFAQEILVDPEFRGKGLGKKLLTEAQRSERVLVGLWLNRAVMQMIQQTGWSKLGNFQTLKKIHAIGAIVRPTLAIGLIKRPWGVLGSILEGKAHREVNLSQDGQRYQVEPINRFGEEFDRFFWETAPSVGIVSDRSAAILNWRYADIPHQRYMMFSCRRDDVLVGYAVARLDNGGRNMRKGIIVDFLARPEEPKALQSLIKKCDLSFRQAKVDFSVSLSCNPVFQKIFADCGYFAARQKPTDSLWIFNDGMMPANSKSRDLSSWYLTYGESDADIW